MTQQSTYTTRADTVEIIEENGKPIAIVINNMQTRHGVVYALKSMTGNVLGTLIKSLIAKDQMIPLPADLKRSKDMKIIESDI